ncbi:unnamed protein product [Prorocentrum cordatum]|uniref:Uncharacterized protein n=1 Tax=Prorocentrum cordatum TaxID=2364126 RepID=A0ABN9WC69_9DINO|nr:unnamed protein product [Polarella glacialis]
MTARVPPHVGGWHARLVLWLAALCAARGSDHMARGGGRKAFIGTYNPQNLVSPARVDAVSAALKSIGIVGLPGTCIRAWHNEPHHRAGAPCHHVIHFGWIRSAMVNKACGCTVLLSKRYFHATSIRRIIPPPDGLRGRGGIVYVESGPLLLWKITSSRLTAWARDELLQVPHRFTPVILTDLNSGLRRRGDDDHAVGPYGSERESYSGQMFHELLTQMKLTAVNTHWDSGHTFFGMGGSSSQIDFVCLPQSALKLVRWTCTWRRTGESIRAMNAILDHVLVVVKFLAVAPVDPRPLAERWDRQSLAGAVLTGAGREEFLIEAHNALLEVERSLDIQESRPTANGHTTLAMATLRQVALKHFSQQQRRPDYEHELEERKWEHLKRRRGLLEQAKAADLAQARHDPRQTEMRSLDDAIRSYTRALHSLRRRRNRERQLHQETELRQAWRARDTHAAPRLARTLARTGIGVKNRNYRAHASCNPTGDEWIVHLAQPALAGGLAGRPVSVPVCHNLTDAHIQALRDTDEYAHPDNYEVSQATLKKAQQDFGMTLKALRRTKIGKFAPSWSCPSEIFKMLVAPAWISAPANYAKQTAGLGPRPAAIFEENPQGPDPHARNQLPHLEQYGEPRRRQGHQAGQSMLHKSFDATNAFGCGDKDQIEHGARLRLETAAEEVEEDDVDYVATISRPRRQSLTVVISGSDHEVAIASGSGGFMGNTSEPELFMSNYHIAVQEWALVDQAATGEAMMINFDDRLPTIDASLGRFMDDIFKTQLVPPTARTAQEVVRCSQRNDAGLDAALAARQYGQNRAKQDVVVSLGSRQLVRQTIQALARSGCRSGYEFKHLGGWFNAVNSNATELAMRLAAINKGWMMVQGFWYSSAPKRVKRLMFISLVSGAALSGTTAYCWTDSEARQICSSLPRKLRSMMGGTSHMHNDHVKVMTTREVYRFWSLVPFSLEALVQRLRMWQAIARSPRQHSHVLGVFFGEMKWELTSEYRCPPTLVEYGQFNSDAVIHPWARQLRRDLEALCDHPEAEYFSLVWESRSMRDLLWDEEVNGLFVSLDVRCIMHNTAYPYKFTDTNVRLPALHPLLLVVLQLVMEVEKKGRWRPQVAASSASSRTGGAQSKPADSDSRKSQKDSKGTRLARGDAGLEGAAAKPKTRRGGRRRAEAKERKLTTKDAGHKDLLLHLSMLASQLAQRSRAMWGITTRTAILEDKSPVIKATQQEGQDFAQVANQKRAEASRLKDQAKAAKDTDGAAARQFDQEADKMMEGLRGLGPPAPAAFCTMIEALANEEIGKRLKDVLVALLAEMEEAPPTYVRLCRLESCKQPDMLKVVFALDRVDLEAQVMEAFRSMGVVTTVGAAPSGYLEDEISAWIDVLKDA